MHYVLLAAQVIALGIAITIIGQIWYFLKRKDIPEDEPLGEERANYLTRRLTALSVCAIIEASLMIAQAVLRFVEGL